MALFKYIIAGKAGKTQELIIEADSSREALNKLRSRKLIPIRFAGEEGVANNRWSFKRSQVNVYEFTRQLAPLLNSYIPLERALAIIGEASTEREQQEFVAGLRQGLHEGKKFSELVRSHGSLFPNYYANLIESGEETGCLPDVVEELYKFMGESKELKDFIVSSSIYPAAILGVVVIVTVLLFTVFVPKFAVIFINMGKELPPTITALTQIGTFLSWAWWLVPLLLFGTWWILRRTIGTDELRWHWYKLLIKIPLLGKITVDLGMCKYLRTMAILLANQVEIIRSVRIAKKIIANPVVSDSFADVDKKLKGGEKLSSALSGNLYIPPSTSPMLRVGEETGNVGEMLQKISANLETDTKLRIKRLLSLFEPVVIIFLALVVLLVVISIFVAMMEINSISQGGL